MFLLALTGCNGVTVFYATFQAGDETVKVVEIVNGELSEAEPKIPAIVGYEGKWEDYSTQNGDVTVKAVYTPIQYTATFLMDGDGTVETRTFTVEDKTIEAPSVPEKTAYRGEWEDFTVRAENFTVRPKYEPVPFTVTFTVDGALFDTKTYDIENRSVEAPAVPEKSGLKGEWEEFDLSEETLPMPRDLSVSALYTSAYATEGIHYTTVSETEYGVYGKNVDGGDVFIAETYRNKPVTKINPLGNTAFAFNGTIGTLFLPKTVNSLGQNTFTNCTIEKMVIMNPDIQINTWVKYASGTLAVGQLFYNGTSGKWNQLTNHAKLEATTVYYYSEEKPASQGRYWHLADDGITPVIWTDET